MTRRAFTKAGCEWGRRTRTAEFEVIVPGTVGKTRRRATYVVEGAEMPEPFPGLPARDLPGRKKEHSRMLPKCSVGW